VRRAVAVVAVSAIIASACTDGAGTTTTAGAMSPYPAAIVDAYLEGCTEEADQAFCACTIEEFQRRLALDEFLALEGDGIEEHPVAAEVIRFCLRGGDGAATTSTTTTEPDAFGPIGTIEELIALTVADLEVYWTATMPEVWGIPYRKVARVEPYFISRGDRPTCGGPLTRDVYEFNAFYCGVEDSVRWDAEGLMASLYEEYGDFTVSLVLAHEWGHAVQARYGFDDVRQPTIVSELQADCFAGAWTGWVAAEHSGLLRLEPGDLEEAMAGFLLIGDELGTAPQGPDAHGTAFERLNAFFEGYAGGADVCAGYEDEWPLMISWTLEQDELDLPYDITAPVLVDALEIFWSIVFPERFGTPWRPVTEVIPYFPSTGDLPTCGGFDSGRDFYELNAFYCAADDFVAWDEEKLFPGLYAEIGDFAIGLVLALRWAEAAQNRAGLPMEGPDAELQAGCFAGTFTAALTIEDNPMLVFLSAGDLEEGIAAFLLFTDHETSGITAFDRFVAFKSGFLDGIDACGA
jgi:predicted metalloprotease